MSASQIDLRAPGAIVLVSCYELGHPPHGLTMAAAFLERAGFQPTKLDAAVADLDHEALRAARFVAISVPMHTALRLGIRVAALVRRIAPDCRICFYGLYAPLHADVLLGGDADWVVGGEYEASLVALAERLASESAAGAAIPEPIVLAKLDFPVPSRHGLPALEKYAQLVAGGVLYPAGYVEASRGCRHRCTHCPIPAVYGGRFFVVPVAVVLEDVRAQVEAGARHITFGDPDFLNGPGHALQVVRGLHAAFPGVSFDFTAKIEHLIEHRALLPELAARGAVFAISAIESLSNRVLEHLQKGHTRADVDVALRALRDAGIALRPSFVPFTPWSTFDDYLAILDWVEAEDLVDGVDPVQLSIRLLLPPGSLLIANPAMRPYLGNLDAAALTWEWTHPDPRLDILQHDAAILVARASDRGEDPRLTFGRLRTLAIAIRDGDAASRERAVNDETASLSNGCDAPARSRPPRLTESWFCCAEPTTGQFEALELRAATPTPAPN